MASARKPLAAKDDFGMPRDNLVDLRCRLTIRNVNDDSAYSLFHLLFLRIRCRLPRTDFDSNKTVSISVFVRCCLMRRKIRKIYKMNLIISIFLRHENPFLLPNEHGLGLFHLVFIVW